MKEYIYILDAGKYKKYKFSTLEAATKAANDYFLKTKEVLCITRKEIKKGK